MYMLLNFQVTQAKIQDFIAGSKDRVIVLVCT